MAPVNRGLFSYQSMIVILQIAVYIELQKRRKVVKKLLLILCVLFIVVFCITVIFAETIDIDDTLVVFDNREKSEPNSINLVAIAGWSVDGKVAIIQQGSYDSPAWLIINTLTDEVLDEDETYMGGGDPDLIYVELSKTMRTYNIVKNSGKLVELPYAFPENMQPLKIEYDETKPYQKYDVYAIRGTKRKKIASISVFGNSAEIKTTFAIKSPFENRVLIITQVKAEHIEFDYTFFSFYYAGCHITAGL
jgi:hypothetical protein